MHITVVVVHVCCRDVLCCTDACSMTAGAQQALRRTMEIYSNTTRFALACNTSTKVSNALIHQQQSHHYTQFVGSLMLVCVCTAELLSTLQRI